jgi:hypothetical protein
MKKIHVVVVNPGQDATVEQIPLEGSFEAVQKLCGGYVETITLTVQGHHRLTIYVNEEGLLMGLPWNRVVPGGSPLAGTLVVVAEICDDGEWLFNDMSAIMQMMVMAFFNINPDVKRLDPTPSSIEECERMTGRAAFQIIFGGEA